MKKSDYWSMIPVKVMVIFCNNYVQFNYMLFSYIFSYFYIYIYVYTTSWEVP